MAASNKTLIQEFYTSFQVASSELSTRLDALKAEGTPPQDAINALALDVAKLRKDLTDATVYLPSYDQRQYEQSLKSIEQSLDDLRSASVGKPKFSFKRKVQKPAAPANVPVVTATTTADTQVPQTSTASDSIVIQGQSHQHFSWLSIPSVTIPATDLSVSNLNHCIVDLRQNSVTASLPTLTAVHMRDVKDSIIILPAVQGSAMIHDMNNCIIVLGCHQFRMHTSTQVDIYLFIESNPIIEHCTKLRFASYPSALSGERIPSSNATHFSVQDFSHIRATPSPNWSLLDEDHRLRPEDWSRLTAAGIESVDQVLQELLARLSL